MGAGSITSNVKSDKTLVVIKSGEEKIETGLKKWERFWETVWKLDVAVFLNPGSIIGANSNVYPLSSVRGVIPAQDLQKTGRSRLETLTKMSKYCMLFKYRNKILKGVMT